MKGKITVDRNDILYRRNRKIGYRSHYYWNGIEIANYTSDNDTVYLNASYLDRDRNSNYMERMENSKNKDMWNDLIEFLDITKDTKLSEYFND